LEVVTLQWAQFPSCRHSIVRLSVRRNFQAVTFSPALVWRETASSVQMSCHADGHRQEKTLHLSSGSSADHRRRTGKPAQAVGSSSLSIMPPIAGPATAAPTKGLGGAECQDLHFCHRRWGCWVGWWSVVCLLRSSAVLQNHEVVVSGWHVRWRHRRRGGGVALAPDAVPDMLQGQERGERSPSARDLHLHR